LWIAGRHLHRYAPPTSSEGVATTSVSAAAEIKQKLDLVDFIGETVPLRKAGTTFKGLCPFHGEKTPSFVVTPARETWHCFGCGRGGDIFTFVMERDGVDFPTALRQLAGRAGVELSPQSSREDAQRKRLREVLEAAIAFYHQVLTAHPQGQPALDYLRGRGFKDTTLETFQLGFAPDSWDALTRQLTAKRGFREDELEAAGLVSRRGSSGSSRGRGVYDRFRGRIIFPIRDASGAASGLGGRVIGAATDTAKYINTPATLLFDKSHTLYLIDRAKSAIRKQGRAVLVEGNTDALMAHQEGFENVVGSLGTALTPGHVELVTRYAPRIALAYDVDAAGQSAATFGATELTALVGEIERSPYRGRLTDVDMVRLPEGRDPDEVIRDDPETWRRATETPQPIMEFLIDRFAQRYDPKSITGREQLINSVVPTLRTITDPVRRDGYVQLLARRAGVDERVVREALTHREPPAALRTGRNSPGSRINLEAIMATPGALDPQAVERALTRPESTLLRLLLLHIEQIERVRDRLTPDLLSSTPARELWKALREASDPATGKSFDRTAFLDGLEPTLSAVARTLYARTDPVPDDEPALVQAVEQSLLTLQRQQLSETIDFKRAELAEAEADDDDAAVSRLTRDVLELQQRRLELDRERASTTLLANRRVSTKP
jgi:DNA primase